MLNIADFRPAFYQSGIYRFFGSFLELALLLFIKYWEVFVGNI